MALYLPDNDLRCGRPATFEIGGRWPRSDLTWRYSHRWAAPLRPSVVRGAVMRAFATIASACGLSFTERWRRRDGEADILIFFARGEHGDGYPLTANINVLAHAWLPMEDYDYAHEGDVHMNAYVPFGEPNTGAWVDVETVLLHELCHAVGLGHSATRQSVMYPSYQGIRRELYPDDIAGLQTLYGPPVVAMREPLPVLSWPVPGYPVISSGYYATRSYGMHAAIDIPCPVGTPVVASADGTVLDSYWADDGGNIVELTIAGGWLLRYVHLSRAEVMPGEDVRRGQVVAFSGNTGYLTRGPHLHFAVWHGNREEALRVQPDPYLYRTTGYWAVDPQRLLLADGEEVLDMASGILVQRDDRATGGTLGAYFLVDRQTGRKYGIASTAHLQALVEVGVLPHTTPKRVPSSVLNAIPNG